MLSYLSTLTFEYILSIKEVNISAKFVVLVMVECIFRADCSIPLYATRSQLLVPFPEEESRILAPIRPFQLEVYSFFKCIN